MKEIPTVTVDQMREVDRIMVEEVGVSILMMMENASRNIAVLARKMLDGSVKNRQIVVLCGKGNNGGDGLGAARHLSNFDAEAFCFLASQSIELGRDAKKQFEVLKNSNQIVYEPGEGDIEDKIKNADLIIDALIGYNLKGSPQEIVADFINIANNSQKPILAVDIPSGLSGDTGQAYAPTIIAASTITLALPKAGLLTNAARKYVGELYIADLSVPKNAYEKLGIDVPLVFEHQEIVKV